MRKYSTLLNATRIITIRAAGDAPVPAARSFPSRILSPACSGCAGENGIHTNADTSGYGSREALVKIMEYADMFYYDLKIIDPDAHERYTGVHNGVILDNLRYLAGSGISVVIRVPLIHTINDTEENLTALAKTVLDVIPAATVNFLPYHEYGSNKYRSIGKQYGMPALEPMTEEQKAIAVDWIRSFGLKCVIS